ncbi:MAG: flippase-like domain-containing protein, partial [Eubacteriaceae bacterium]|nr:flippase-like domain-containing protein [Eubacteriaceae bacterium]
LGLFAHVFFSLVLVLLSYTDYLKKIIIFVFKKLKKLNLFKKSDEASFSLKLDEYSEYMTEMKDNKKAMFLIIFLSIIQITAYFSVTYFVYRAFRLDTFSFFDLLAIQSIVYIVVSFIPTPGNAVASESGFYVLFQPFFPPAVLIYAVLIWRFITYYLNIIFNGGVLIIIKIIEIVSRKLQRNSSYKI